MNLSLVISYIIAGIITLSIIMMNISVSRSSTELTMTQLVREKAATVTELISHDLQIMGYNRLAKTDPIIQEAHGHKIIFNSNIDNSTNRSVETITWEFTNTEVTSTKNEDDYILKRTVDYVSEPSEVTNIGLGVTKFIINYYDDYGEPRSDSLTTPNADPSIIKQLYITIRFESAEKLYNNTSSDGRHIVSVWEKRFSPPNLEDN
jgi:hypothetical protein